MYVNMYVCIIKAGEMTLRLCFKDPLILISIAGMTAKVRLLFLFEAILLKDTTSTRKTPRVEPLT